MAEVEIVSEEEGTGAWSFVVQMSSSRGPIRQWTLRLAWADYNLWSRDGADPPASVARAVFAFLLERRRPEQLRPSFDASSIRRQHPEADEVIPTLIRP